jgi:hypothetical protein
MTPQQRATMTVEFSLDALLRASLKERMEIYSSAVQNGIKSRNECRQLENDPPYEGGDVFTAQSNLTPIEKLGEEPKAPMPQTSPEEARAAKRAEERHEEALKALTRPQPVNVTMPAVTVHTHAAKVETTVHQPEAPVVNVSNHVEPPRVDVKVEAAPAPSVTVHNSVEPTPVEVKLEATLPAPEVTVNLPPRRTDTTVTRDDMGNIVRATQIEKDA